MTGTTHVFVPNRLPEGDVLDPADLSPQREARRLLNPRCRQWLACTSVTLTMVMVGTVYGWTTTSLLQLTSGTGDVPLTLTHDESSWVVSLTVLGSMIGSLVGAKLADRIGRKRSLLLCCTIFILGWLMVYTANFVPNLYMARVVLGIAVGIAYTLNPMYVSEVADINIRGAVGTLIAVNVFAGSLLTCFLGLWVTYTSLLIVLVIISFIPLLTNMCFPETPYFLVSKGRKKQACKSITYYKGIVDPHEMKTQLRALRPQTTCKLQPRTISDLSPQSTSNTLPQFRTEFLPEATSDFTVSSRNYFASQSGSYFPSVSFHEVQSDPISEVVEPMPDLHLAYRCDAYSQPISVRHSGALYEVHSQPTSVLRLQSSRDSVELLLQPPREFRPQSTSELQLASRSEVQPPSISEEHPASPSEIHPESTDKVHPQPKSEVHPEPTSEIHPQPTSEVHPEPTSGIHPEPTSEIHPEPTSGRHPEHTSEVHPESTSEVHPEPTSKIHPESTSKVHPEPTSGIHPESTSEIHAQPTSEVHPEPTSEIHAQPTSKVHPEPTSEIHPQPTSEVHPEPTSEIHPQPTSEVHPEPTSGIHPEPTSEIHPEPTSEVHPESTSEVHPEPTSKIHPESTSEVHPESTSEVHPERTSGIHTESTSGKHPEPTSEVHPEPTSEVHPEPTSEVHPVSTSEVHPEPTSGIHTEPTSKIHPVPTSEVHSESTSGMRTELTSGIHTAPASGIHPEPTSELQKSSIKFPSPGITFSMNSGGSSGFSEAYVDVTKQSWLKKLRAIQQRHNRKALSIMLGLIIAQQLSGNFVTIQYLEVLFSKTTIGIKPNVATIMILAVGLLSGILSTLTVESLGRKTLLILSTLGTFGTLFILASYLLLVQHKFDVSIVSILPVIDLIIYQVMYQIGLGTLPNVLLCELFPAELKGFVGAITVIFDGIIGFAVSKLYQVITDSVGSSAIYFIFAIACFLAYLMVMKWVPETKGKTYQEIEALLVGKNLNSLNEEVRTDEMDIRRI